MAQQTCSPETALTALRAAAGSRGRTLQEVAADVVARTGEPALSGG